MLARPGPHPDNYTYMISRHTRLETSSKPCGPVDAAVGEDGGAVFVDDAYVAFESYRADANGDVEAAEVSMLGADGSVACRFLGVYRPPRSGVVKQGNSQAGRSCGRK